MIKRFFRRHVLWVGFLAVLVPLGVLLSLQYGWLTDLERKSAVAEKAYLKNYLGAVSDRVEYYYRAQAERALNIPGALLALDCPDKVEHYFAKKKPDAAKALFIANFTDSEWGGVQVFDPIRNAFVEPEDTAMLQAIFVALAPWKTLAHKGAAIKSPGIAAEEKDPYNRMLLNPITDDGSKILGLAGMIVDGHHFREVVLPTAVKKSVPADSEKASRENLVLTIRDGSGRLVRGTPEDLDEPTGEVTGRIGFLFSDWELALRGQHMTPEEWAKSNFLLNISMSALLAATLLGGIVLALRTASREIRLSRMKSDFVSNVSHELRTPLASIRVFGEFLKLGRAKTEDKTREYGEYIETESRRLTQLINNILDFSRIESGAKTYTFAATRIEKIVEDSARTLRVGLAHRGFDLVFEPPAEPLPPVEADADAIAQALSNLVDNAVKYSKGPSEVRLGLRRVDGEVQVSVTDRGIGITTEEQKMIFERFHRVSASLVHNVKGSGLGLAIVRHVVRAHGGRVSVDSEPGRGSTFTIHLPAVQPAPKPADAAVDTVGWEKN